MNCRECAKEINSKYPYCPYCTTPNSQTNSISMGNDNVNVGVGNTGTQNIHIDSINNIKNTEKKSKSIDYKYIYSKKDYGTVEDYKKKLDLVTVLSVISSAITIITYNVAKDSVGIFGLATWILLYIWYDRTKIYRDIKNRGIYKSDKKKLKVNGGHIYPFTILGDCPICNGSVRVRYDSEYNKDIGTCNRNSDHEFTYDYTIMSGEPIQKQFLKVRVESNG